MAARGGPEIGVRNRSSECEGYLSVEARKKRYHGCFFSKSWFLKKKNPPLFLPPSESLRCQLFRPFPFSFPSVSIYPPRELRYPPAKIPNTQPGGGQASCVRVHLFFSGSIPCILHAPAGGGGERRGMQKIKAEGSGWVELDPPLEVFFSCFLGTHPPFLCCARLALY